MNRNEHTESDDPVKVKVVVIGDMCVGKTAIAHRFTKNDFEDKMSHTVGGKTAELGHENHSVFPSLLPGSCMSPG